MREALKEEFRSRYLDHNGLGFFQDQLGRPEANSDNPILLSSFGWTMFRDELLPADLDLMQLALRAIEDPLHPGIFHRRPGDNTHMEAHDNYDGVTAMSILSNGQQADRICEWGEKHGWQFANTDPLKYSWKQLRQGGSIGYYKIAAGRIPYPIEMAWLCLGLVHALSFGWASTINLAWLKMRTIPIALARQTNEALWGWVKQWWAYCLAVLESIATLRHSWPASMQNYFGQQHIFTRLGYQGAM